MDDLQAGALCSYALPSTDLAYGAIGLRSCCAMSGTELAYGSTRRIYYALNSTDIAHAVLSA
eukprot:2061719-Rhodomonas_salina.2